ncbi:MAG: hypothetical protein WDM78_00570 [Puia sp.]
MVLPVGEVKLSNAELAAVTGVSDRLPRTGAVELHGSKRNFAKCRVGENKRAQDRIYFC